LAGLATLFILAFPYPWLLPIAKMGFGALLCMVAADALMLFGGRDKLSAMRHLPHRFSNGDDNLVEVNIENRYRFPITFTVIDELPYQFQIRNFRLHGTASPGQKRLLTYSLKPVKRGIYQFGSLHVFVETALGMLARRHSASKEAEVMVYPSFMQMKKFELLAFSRSVQEAGIKKVRKTGLNREFEQIKEYVTGDDFRAINWKASARQNQLMVNQYEDEKSQQVYCLIDKGRTMQMPFKGMTLLDYAVNASLVTANIALQKHDKAGLITFSHRISTVLKAAAGKQQLVHYLDALARQKTAFKEADFEKLFLAIKTKVPQRSLLLLFTNFEGEIALNRQLAFFKLLAKVHLLVVIFFENTTLSEILEQKAHSVEEVYVKSVVEQFDYEKRLLVKTLHQYGIHALLTTPERLSIDTLNKYLEIKSRGLL
jgi:uncharacterized protein (DUF58 family)